MKRTAVQRASTWRTSRGRVVAAAVVLGALSAVAFSPGTAGAAPSRTSSDLSTAKAKQGTILVSDGSTVYTLKPSKTACTAKCLKAWPPVLLPQGVTTATASTGVDASMLGTVAAAHGALQITYAGEPLYWYAKDKAPGQVHGNVKNKWGTWSTVVPPATAAPASAPPTTAPPTTAPPTTAPPATDPPTTAPPATAPPTTAPPTTSPPAPKPPTVTSPSTGGVGF